MLNLGFGFVELGTVTPMPQKGNPMPRVFKIPEFEAVIQRLGFNNNGIEMFLENLKKSKKNDNILGVNIGKIKILKVNFLITLYYTIKLLITQIILPLIFLPLILQD